MAALRLRETSRNGTRVPHLTERELTGEQRRRFLAHASIGRLTLQPLAVLVAAAKAVAGEDSLKLDRWLQQAEACRLQPRRDRHR